MPKSKKITREDVTKKIMPNRCDLCGIGIGVSMLYFENAWRPHKHLHDKIQRYYSETYGSVKLCDECFADLNKHQDKDSYILFCKTGRI